MLPATHLPSADRQERAPGWGRDSEVLLAPVYRAASELAPSPWAAVRVAVQTPGTGRPLREAASPSAGLNPAETRSERSCLAPTSHTCKVTTQKQLTLQMCGRGSHPQTEKACPAWGWPAPSDPNLGAHVSYTPTQGNGWTACERALVWPMIRETSSAARGRDPPFGPRDGGRGPVAIPVVHARP